MWESIFPLPVDSRVRENDGSKVCAIYQDLSYPWLAACRKSSRGLSSCMSSPSNTTIDLYTRTYYSLLRSSRAVKIRTLVESHLNMKSALHVDGSSTVPDISALIYCLLRLPECIVNQATLVVMAQSEQAFMRHGYAQVESWRRVSAPARRRRSYFDGEHTLAFYIASRSDIDDLIPMLAAFQIERDKLHARLNRPEIISFLEKQSGQTVSSTLLDQLSAWLELPIDKIQRLHSAWGERMPQHLLGIAQQRLSYSVRSLAGSVADYRRATRSWWEHAEASLPDILFANRPIYFISSNTHSIANSLTGFALRHEAMLVDFIRDSNSAELQREYADIQAQNVPSSHENFLYYTLKKYEAVHPDFVTQRLQDERENGIHRVPSQHVFDSEIQVIEVNKLDRDKIDPRVCLDGIEQLAKSDALIINIDYPLGMAAYQLLSELSHNIASIRGVLIIGKAATLNGRIGDVMLPSTVYDAHSGNTYWFDNCISADEVAPHLVYGNVLDNQKAVTVLGTFLQNESQLSFVHQEGYADMEMEAGPYLSCVYEMIRPKRYPTDKVVNLHNCPFPVGILHYASDTPMSKGQNLGAMSLSYLGMDPTYATTVAALRSVIREEIRIQSEM